MAHLQEMLPATIWGLCSVRLGHYIIRVNTPESKRLRGDFCSFAGTDFVKFMYISPRNFVWDSRCVRKKCFFKQHLLHKHVQLIRVIFHFPILPQYFPASSWRISFVWIASCCEKMHRKKNWLFFDWGAYKAPLDWWFTSITFMPKWSRPSGDEESWHTHPAAFFEGPLVFFQTHTIHGTGVFTYMDGWRSW